MYKSIKHLLILFCASFLLCSVLSAQQEATQSIKSYKAELAAPIKENDIAQAKNNVFITLQHSLISLAIQDLIGEELFGEYEDQLLKQGSFRPADYLTSVKILKESKDSRNFSMQMQGEIQMAVLAEELKKKGMIFKTDPWQNITLLVEEGMTLPLSDLEARLKLFHLHSSAPVRVAANLIPKNELLEKDAVKLLFQQFPQNQVLFLIDALTEQNKEFSEIRVRIFRKSTFEQLNRFSLKIKATNPPTKKTSLDDEQQEDFLSLFSLISLKTDYYEDGLQSVLQIEIRGLEDPYQRWIFEEKILKASRTANSWSLIAFTTGMSRYKIQLNTDISTFTKVFQKPNSWFYFLVEKADDTSISLSAFFKGAETVSDIQEWKANPTVIKQIQDIIQQEDLTQKKNSGSEPLEAGLDSSYFPSYTETEPNDNSTQVNRLPPSTLIIGQISSRKDEDIFLLERQVESNTVMIEWMRIGKTSLSPQIRLYDDEFRFLANYPLIGSQNKLKFSYTFKEATPPQRIYIRISDRVGFIQGETGGFKSFYYLLKYQWKQSE